MIRLIRISRGQFLVLWFHTVVGLFAWVLLVSCSVSSCIGSSGRSSCGSVGRGVSRGGRCGGGCCCVGSGVRRGRSRSGCVVGCVVFGLLGVGHHFRLILLLRPVRDALLNRNLRIGRIVTRWVKLSLDWRG